MSLDKLHNVQGMTVCDCGHKSFFVGLEITNKENYIKILECNSCGKQMIVPFQECIVMPKKPRYHSPSLWPLIAVLAIVAALAIFWSQIAKWALS